MRKIVGILLMVIGLAVVFYPQLEKQHYDHGQQQLVRSFEQLGNTEQIEQASNQYEDTLAVQKYNQPTGEKSKLLEGARGIININKIDLEMIIFDGTTPETLSKGIGMIEPEKELGVHNIGLAGHRAVAKGKQFNRMNELRINDEIQVTTQEGTYEFVIVDSFIVHQSDVSVLDDQEGPLLTLVTCTPLGAINPPNRLIVQAVLKK
ncbi:class D sortase [Sporosarcina sp. FSL K6-1540]|uniref:class D sortase n=1 Tax=Sporosarcina sp. FSL K6-1540 TaxID=2921555 RepID=UPI00315A45F7